MHEVHYYFAYGSNMNVNRARERKLRFINVSSAWLHGFNLKFNKRSRNQPVSGRANVVQRSDSLVYGVLYQLISPSEIVSMDPYEHAPIDYRRMIVEVKSADSTVSSWTYVANPAVLDNSLLPTRSYLDHLIAGRDYLPKTYVSKLDRMACVD